MEEKLERLQKFLAEAGVASRRRAEELIAQGKVKVNGRVVTEMGLKIDPEKDEVSYLDRKISKKDTKLVYLMLHKPVGYVTTAKEQFGRPAVVDLIKGVNARIFPVGRLDYDTSGLLLLTNDGDLTYKLTHPKHDVEKTYIAKLQILEREKDGRFCTAEIVIHEGRNRQVRKMCESIKHPVAQLQRVATGELTLGDLPKGKYRHLTEKEIRYLKRL